MAWLRRDSYDRARLLSQATQAMRRRRTGKALQLYQQILEHEPNNPDLHRRVAPLLARQGKRDEAWESYQRAGENLAQRGFVEQAIGIYKDACDRLPRRTEAYLSVADLEVGRGRPRDAIAALVQGRRRFRRRRDLNEAARLLRRARQIDPKDFEIGFDLANLAARSGLHSHADKLLEQLVGSCTRRQLRRVRRRQFFLAPGPGRAWRWLCATLGLERPGRVRRVAA